MDGLPQLEIMPMVQHFTCHFHKLLMLPDIPSLPFRQMGENVKSADATKALEDGIAGFGAAPCLGSRGRGEMENLATDNPLPERRLAVGKDMARTANWWS